MNVMTPRSREYYDIEAFWKEGQYLDLADVLLPSGPTGPQPDFLDDSNDDSFWDGADADDALELTAEEREVAANGVELKANDDEEDDEVDPFWDLDEKETAAMKVAPDEEDPFWS